MGHVLRTGEVWRPPTPSSTARRRADGGTAGLVEAGSPRGMVVRAARAPRRAARPRGALSLYSRTPRRFTDAELAHVRAMTDMLSVALANADLVETLRRAEWRYRTLFRGAPDVVLVVLADGEVREGQRRRARPPRARPRRGGGAPLGECIAEGDHAAFTRRARGSARRARPGAPSRAARAGAAPAAASGSPRSP
jgi:hypothetical protein